MMRVCVTGGLFVGEPRCVWSGVCNWRLVCGQGLIVCGVVRVCVTGGLFVGGPRCAWSGVCVCVTGGLFVGGAWVCMQWCVCV